MQEILDFMLKNGIPVDANTILVLAFVYFGVVRWLKQKIDGLSGTIEAYFETQKARELAHRKLSSSIDNLCAAVGGRRQDDFHNN